MYIGMFNIAFISLELFMVYALLNNFEFKYILYTNTVYWIHERKKIQKKKKKSAIFLGLHNLLQTLDEILCRKLERIRTWISFSRIEKHSSVFDFFHWLH